MPLNKIKFSLIPSLIVLLSSLSISGVFAQNDEQQILKTREASNAALKAYDDALIDSFLTDDVLITTGAGTLLSGKESLKQYVLDAGESKMYWVRTAEAIEVNEAKGLAWENGTWKGYDPEQGNLPIVGGKYAAMWTKASGVWLIKSQLFVTLE